MQHSKNITLLSWIYRENKLFAISIELVNCHSEKLKRGKGLQLGNNDISITYFL